MYFHWKKQRDADPKGACTEMTGFTRLVASAGGRPDGLEGEVPSAFVKEYTGQEASKFHGYRVVNRPYSVVQFLKSAAWRALLTLTLTLTLTLNPYSRPSPSPSPHPTPSPHPHPHPHPHPRRAIPEEYVYIAETDHLLMHALPNLASRGSPMAHVFGYMGANPAHAGIVKSAWPEGGADGYKRVQSIGPSPVVIHRDDLEKVALLGLGLASPQVGLASPQG